MCRYEFLLFLAPRLLFTTVAVIIIFNQSFTSRHLRQLAAAGAALFHSSQRNLGLANLTFAHAFQDATSRFWYDKTPRRTRDVDTLVQGQGGCAIDEGFCDHPVFDEWCPSAGHFRDCSRSCHGVNKIDDSYVGRGSGRGRGGWVFLKSAMGGPGELLPLLSLLMMIHDLICAIASTSSLCWKHFQSCLVLILFILYPQVVRPWRFCGFSPRRRLWFLWKNTQISRTNRMVCEGFFFTLEGTRRKTILICFICVSSAL